MNVYDFDCQSQGRFEAVKVENIVENRLKTRWAGPELEGMVV